MSGKVAIEVTRVSPFSGRTRTITVQAYPESFIEYEQGALIQNAFPYLSADEREFIMTGITEEEWDTLLRPDYEEGDLENEEASF